MTLMMERMGSSGKTIPVMARMIGVNQFRIFSEEAMETLGGGSTRFRFCDLGPEVAYMTIAVQSPALVDGSFLMRNTRHSRHFIPPHQFLPVQEGRVEVYSCRNGRTRCFHSDALIFQFYDQRGLPFPALTVRVFVQRGAHSPRMVVPSCPDHGLKIHALLYFVGRWELQRGCPLCEPFPV